MSAPPLLRSIDGERCLSVAALLQGAAEAARASAPLQRQRGQLLLSALLGAAEAGGCRGRTDLEARVRGADPLTLEDFRQPADCIEAETLVRILAGAGISGAA